MKYTQYKTKDLPNPGEDHEITGTKVTTVVCGVTGKISNTNTSAYEAGTHKRRACDNTICVYQTSKRRCLEVDRLVQLYGSEGLCYQKLLSLLRRELVDQVPIVRINASGEVRVGSHSIVSDYNLTDLVADIKPGVQPPARYLIDYMLDGVHNSMDDIGYRSTDDGAGGYWLVASRIVQSARNGAVETAVKRESRMAQRVRFAPNQTTLMKIQWGGSRKTGEVPEEMVDPFRVGACINVKAIVGILSTELRAMNNMNAGILGSTMEIGLDRFDNSSLYAKAWFTYNLLHMCKAANYSPGLPVGVPSTAITIADLGLNTVAVDVLNARIEAGDFILVSHRDWNVRDLQIIVWLALGGNRPAADPTNVAVFPAHYVNLPEIRFCLIWNSPNPAPALPTPGPIDPDELISFISRLARLRSEEGDFVNGWHLAVSTTYLQVEPTGDNGNKKFAVGAYLDVLGEDWPKPRDYSFVCRLIRLVKNKPDNQEVKLLDRLMQFTSTQVISLGAVCWQLISAFSATLMYDFSIRGREMHVHRGGGRVDANVALIWDILTRPNQLTDERVCGLYSQVSTIIEACTGAFWPCEFRTQCIWGGAVNYTGFATHGYATWGQNGTPYSGDVLSLDGWLINRPIEWGLTSLKPRCTFQSEVQLYGPAVRRGWLGVHGDELYLSRPQGQRPYMVVPYGAMALNVLLQTERPDTMWVVSGWKSPWFVARMPTWESRQVMPQPVFDPELHIIKPLTLYSWDWVTHEVWAPEVNCPNISEEVVYKWSSFKETDMAGAGFQSDNKVIRHLPGDKIAMELPFLSNLSTVKGKERNEKDKKIEEVLGE